MTMAEYSRPCSFFEDSQWRDVSSNIWQSHIFSIMITTVLTIIDRICFIQNSQIVTDNTLPRQSRHGKGSNSAERCNLRTSKQQEPDRPVG